jgi:uncharacterized protein (TIGR02679 family)
MKMPEETTTVLQRAVTFFQQPVWTRLFDAIYQKYMAQGSVQGRVVLRDCTSEELREIARFLHKPVSDRPDLVIQLVDIQKVLNRSSLACPLPDLLQALYPDRSHTTRAIQRQRQVQAQQTFGELLTTLANDLPSDARGRQWLFTGQHGKEALFRRYKNESSEVQNQLLHSLCLVIDALQQLPMPPQRERLALFAQRISGDPHCFDANTLSGRLLQQALTDLSQGNQIAASAKNLTEPGDTSPFPLPEQEQQRFFLYAEAGILVDTISSTVAVFHPIGAETTNGHADPLIEQAGEHILILPLRQVLTWHKLHPASEHVYLFENPPVFEEVVDTLTAKKQQLREPRRILPTLICTSGWPSVAAIQLLNAIANACPNVTFHYSGDFDLQGLRIAAHLLVRYPQNCQLWHFDSRSYSAALHPRATTLESGERAGLQRLSPAFAPLVAAMEKQGKKAYQEGIVPLLIKDTWDDLIEEKNNSLR